MILKDGSQLSLTALSRPQSGQEAWIDVLVGAEPGLKEVMQTLGWDSLDVSKMGLGFDRAQLQSTQDLLILNIFVPEGDALNPLAVFVGPNALVTQHTGVLSLIDNLKQDLPQKVDLLQSGRDLLYEILQRTADCYLERMDQYEEQFDVLEEAILNGGDRSREVFALRRTLHHLRGLLADMRRIAARLSRRQFSVGPNTAQIADMSGTNIFVDVYDSFYHAMDNLDSLRDNLTGLVDLQLNQRSTRLNEVMKFLTIFSTIFLPLTFITGFLGMNLKSMPELTLPFGQEFTLLLMAVVGGTMLYIFKRRHWL
ncbi:MAG: magnesium transporter CorA family protein [Firmicutes bacterium]|jgi:magnesium transporter|uniref:Magnesium transporter CorA n=1 Tax=Sulfobacillus benefaciens TaxID=453960 RepID=A0A2T2X4E1_9FIRM|nr:magnesium transporter CorA family protein [Bacillota bacterium]MCL5012585.1 magnesium transporter CorA family protein [Bacillota bacterium]PSR29361.1 MAG: hypothetical protein C7B43_08435 [Sulfobacillus benefaciens]